MGSLTVSISVSKVGALHKGVYLAQAFAAKAYRAIYTNQYIELDVYM